MRLESIHESDLAIRFVFTGGWQLELINLPTGLGAFWSLPYGPVFLAPWFVA